jgi:hypothetical protein
MSAYIRLFLVFICVSVSVDIYPQICLRKKNQTDSDGNKHGYWIEVSKSDPGNKTFKGWYDHGNETKRCTYYNNGVRWSKFRYLNDSLMRMKRYTTEGNLDYKGSALLLRNNDEIRFCWDGEFVFYDSHRRKIKRVTYVRGVEQDLE